MKGDHPPQDQMISPPSSEGAARLATARPRKVSLTRRMSGSASRWSETGGRWCGCGRTASPDVRTNNPWSPPYRGGLERPVGDVVKGKAAPGGWSGRAGRWCCELIEGSVCGDRLLFVRAASLSASFSASP